MCILRGRAQGRCEVDAPTHPLLLTLPTYCLPTHAKHHHSTNNSWGGYALYLFASEAARDAFVAAGGGGSGGQGGSGGGENGSGGNGSGGGSGAFAERVAIEPYLGSGPEYE